MSELRRDPLTGNWVIIAKERAQRPGAQAAAVQNDPDGEPDPFAEGNERFTPSEVYALREGSPRDAPGWRLRAFPNRYPALRVEGEATSWGEGLFDALSGTGAHEVVVETPDGALPMSRMTPLQLAAVLEAWRARVEDLSRDRRFSYIQVFKNQGPRSGATQAHAHSQIIALPLLPPEVARLLRRTRRYHDAKRRQLQSDLLAQEREAGARIVQAGRHFMALCPYASQHPFELQITPLDPGAEFSAGSPEQRSDLAEVLAGCFSRWRSALGETDFNLMLINAPNRSSFDESWAACGDPDEHFRWHLRLAPRTTLAGGFEFATGIYINSVPPEEAAAYLRAAHV